MEQHELEDLKKIFEKNIKNEEININETIKEIFDKEKYNTQLKTNTEEYYKSYNNNLKKIINHSLNENDKILEKEINSIISNYSNQQQKNLINHKNAILGINEELCDIKEQTECISDGIKELHDAILSKEFILGRSENFKKIDKSKKNQNDNNLNPNHLDLNKL